MINMSFVLGICNCSCGSEIPIRNKKRFLQKFKHGHNNKGSLHPNYKDKQITWNNYIYTHRPNHPFAKNQKRIMEHRVVWEEANNAMLLPWGIVHHKDGNRQNNNITNLEAMMRSTHCSLHHKGVPYYVYHKRHD